MLKRVHIRKFRSCEDVQLDELGGVTALIGRNGVGKSNVLRAINWAARMSSGQFSLQAAAPWRQTGNIELEFVLGLRTFVYSVDERRIPALELSETLNYRLEATEKLDEVQANGEKETLLSKDSEGLHVAGIASPILVEPSFAMLPAATSMGNRLKESDTFASTLQYLSGIRYYPLNELNYEESSDRTRIIVRSDFTEWLRSSNSSRYSSADALMRILAMYLFHKDKFAEFSDLVGVHDLGFLKSVHIHTLETEDASTKDDTKIDGVAIARFYAIYFEEPAKSRPFVSFAELSHGTRRVIDIIAALLYDQSSVMLLEHPEDAVHVGLLSKLMGILDAYSNIAQAIVATHSRTILNSLSVRQLRFVGIKDGSTTVFRLRGDRLQQADEFICSEVTGGGVAEFVDTMEDSVGEDYE